MTALAAFLDTLDAASRTADEAEAAIRADFARRIALAADERAIAYRRLNLVRSLAETIGPAADETEAAARGAALLQARFGWETGPATPHGEIAAAFAPVCRALWRAGREDGAESSPPRHAAEARHAPSRSTQDGSACFDTRPAGAPQHDEGGDCGPENVDEALATFETWYVARTGASFWVLFDNPMPETPRVDY